MNITPRTIVQRNTQIVASEMGDEVVMVSLARDNYYALDEIGARIWARLEQPLAVDDLCAALRQEFEVDEATCLRDVTALLEKLVTEKLVLVQPQ